MRKSRACNRRTFLEWQFYHNSVEAWLDRRHRVRRDRGRRCSSRARCSRDDSRKSRREPATTADDADRRPASTHALLLHHHRRRRGRDAVSRSPHARAGRWTRRSVRSRSFSRSRSGAMASSRSGSATTPNGRRTRIYASRTTIAAFSFVARAILWTMLRWSALNRLGSTSRRSSPASVSAVSRSRSPCRTCSVTLRRARHRARQTVRRRRRDLGRHDDGTVEHVGLKTTRIRSVNGEQLIFSNTDLLKSRIRNFKRMQERRVRVDDRRLVRHAAGHRRANPEPCSERRWRHSSRCGSTGRTS